GLYQQRPRPRGLEEGAGAEDGDRGDRRQRHRPRRQFRGELPPPEVHEDADWKGEDRRKVGVVAEHLGELAGEGEPEQHNRDRASTNPLMTKNATTAP